MTIVERLLMAHLPIHMCFAESDADTAGGGSEVDGDDIDTLLDAPDGAHEAEGAPETEGTEGEDDAEDVDYEGQTYRLPKTLKEALMRNADYTNGKKALAESQRQHEARVRTETELLQLRGIVDGETRQLQHLDKQLSDWNKVTEQQWLELKKTDPDAWREAKDQLRDIRDQRSGLLDGLRGKVNDLQNRQSTAEREATQAAEAALAKRIKGWSPEKKAALVKFATERDIPQAAINMALQIPGAIELVHEAMLYRAGLKSPVVRAATGAPGAAATARPAAKPVTRVAGTGGRTDTAPSDKDDPDTWAVKRRAQLAQRKPSGRFQAATR